MNIVATFLFHSDIEVQQYTDDTAMARSVAGSLIENKGLNITDMAKR